MNPRSTTSNVIPKNMLSIPTVLLSTISVKNSHQLSSKISEKRVRPLIPPTLMSDRSLRTL